MPDRSSRLLWIPAVVLGCAGLAAALWWRHAATAALPALATGTILEHRRELPDFTLIDHHGRDFARARLLGSWSLLFFGYTHCPDVCPATLSTLAAFEQRLRTAGAGRRPQVVFISVDAARDTPEQLARYVPYFDPGFIGLTARDQAGIEALARDFGVVVMLDRHADGSYTVDHSTAIFVVDPRGRLAAILTGPFTAESLRADYLRIVAARA